jgi:hypothetical protein
MTKGSNMSVEPIHSLGAVLRGALLLVLFTLGVEIYAQSYNMSESYRIGGTTQTTPSVAQGGYGGSTSQGGQASAGGYAMPQGFREVGQKSYNAYQSTVYEPFTAAAPSDNHPMAAGAGEPQITGKKNAFPGSPADPGKDQTHPGNPVGEPFVLLFFAAVAAMVIAWRKKEPTPTLPEGKE